MLGIWMYDWAWPGETPAPEPAPAAVTTRLGSKKAKGPFPNQEREPALHAFWEVREAYLKRIHNVVEEELPHETVVEELAGLAEGLPEAKAIAEVVAERERAYRAATSAATLGELKREAGRITDLTMKIVKLREQRRRNEEEEEEILILLMS